MRKKIGILITVLLVFFRFDNQVKAEEPGLYAKAAVLMDASNGRVLYGKNENEVMPMASTTKIMTCIIALEYGNENDIVTFSEYAASMPKVHLGASAGKQFYLRDLLFSLMLESHNDSAVAIAEHVGGSMEGFIELMNQKARDIGCNDTYFVTPNGLDGTALVENTDGSTTEIAHGTTAKDLARIMKYCLTESDMRERFIEITATPSYQFQGYYCTNHNSLFQIMEGVVSGKTGYTSKAGYCYVGAVEKEGNLYIVALLACGWPNHKTYKWADTKELIAYAIDEFEYYGFPEGGELDIPKEVVVKNGMTDELGEICYVPVKLIEDSLNIDGMLLSKEDQIRAEVEIVKAIDAPVRENEVIGSIVYSVNDVPYKIYHLMTAGEVDKKDFKWAFKKIIENFSLFCLTNR